VAFFRFYPETTRSKTILRLEMMKAVEYKYHDWNPQPLIMVRSLATPPFGFSVHGVNKRHLGWIWDSYSDDYEGYGEVTPCSPVEACRCFGGTYMNSFRTKRRFFQEDNAFQASSQQLSRLFRQGALSYCPPPPLPAHTDSNLCCSCSRNGPRGDTLKMMIMMVVVVRIMITMMMLMMT
jgi:hypothetical protein